MRGIAVLAVMAYHFNRHDLGGSGQWWLQGGFLGVDLFFVLSGFLITSLLLDEYHTSGVIDIPAFWLRRARRLLPALFLLLAAVVVYAGTRPPFEKTTLRWDIFASLAYVLNWRFIITGQTYFDSLVPPSPLRHLWSLAIEEQFYVVWPLLVTGTLAFVATRGRKAARVVVGILIAAVLASVMVLAATYNPVDPSRAYFGTDARVHEVLIGAAAAILIAGWSAGDARVRLSAGTTTFAALAGLAAIVAMMLTLNDRAAMYYRGGSALFSIATAITMICVLDERTPVARLLAMRSLAYIGTISYGLYLWHWPAIIWLSEERTALQGLSLLAVRMIVTVGAALLSFYLLETPVRSGRLRGLAARGRPALLSATCCVVILVAATAVTTRGAKPVPDYLRGGGSGTQSAQVPPGGVALLGDSVALGFQPQFMREATARGYPSTTFAFAGCEMGDLERVGRDGKRLEGRNQGYCTTLQFEPWQKLIARAKPSVVFVHSRRDGYDILQDGVHLRAGTHAWSTAFFAEWDRILQYVRAHGAGKLVVILPIYRVGEIGGCERAGVRNDPAAGCGAEREGFMGTGPLRYAYKTWAARHDPSLVQVVDLAPLLCPAAGKPCPELIHGQRMRLAEDGIHFTREGERFVMPKVFDGAGVEPR